MTHTRSLAAAQTTPIRGDVPGNIEQHLRLAHVAANEQAEVLVFPELSLTGYELDLARDLSFARSDDRLTPLVEAASSCSMTLVVGAPIRIKSLLQIGAFIISPVGKIEIYTKHHLGAFSPDASCDGIVPPAEPTIFHPGTSNPLIQFTDHTAAVAVCADINRPSHPQQAAERGATIYLASVFAIPSELHGDMTKLQAYATEHAMAVVMANFGGSTGGLDSAGRSAIWSDKGELLIQLDPTGAGVAVATESTTGWRTKAIMIDNL